MHPSEDRSGEGRGEGEGEGAGADPLRGFAIDAPGARLVAEPMRVAHADAMFAWLADPALHVFTDLPPPADVESLRRRHAKLLARCSPDGREGWLNWAVLDARGASVGHLQATLTDAGAGPAWIGYVFARAVHGRGWARASVAAMCRELADAHGAARLLASVEAANARSIALLRAVGFDDEGDAGRDRLGLGPSERLFARSGR